jgi:hypothetical protein
VVKQNQSFHGWGSKKDKGMGPHTPFGTGHQ